MSAVPLPHAASDSSKLGLPHDDAQKMLVLTAGVLIAGLCLYVWTTTALQQAINLLMGFVLGYALFRAAFGFTGPWRSFMVRRRSMGVRKTLLALGAAAVIMMSLGALGGYPIPTFAIGWSLFVGAFLFGIGMQLGGCCGSGSAWVAGGGSARVMIVVVFFIVGSVWGSIDIPTWGAVDPTSMDPVGAPDWWGAAKFWRFSMVESWGLAPAILATLAILVSIWLATTGVERARHGSVEHFEAPSDAPAKRVIYGPWAPWAGGLVMGVLTGLVLWVTNAPWGITFGYTIYGAKILTTLGADLAAWTAPGTETAFWTLGPAQAALEQPLWLNNGANMNIGIMIGAAVASGLNGEWRPTLKDVPFPSILAAALAGILMGYGARISPGCNIGAMVNGIASGSLHGWMWMAAAVVGNIVGVLLRPRFQLEN